MRASIIIPTCGRSGRVRTVVRSLLDSRVHRAGAEVLLVDNNSDESVSRGLRDHCDSLDGMVQYLAEPSPGLGAARHCGAREARGEILVFVDDDIEVSESWLDALLEAFDDREVGIAGGPSVPRFSSSVPAWFWEFIGPTPYGGWACGWLSLLDIGRSLNDIDPDWIWGLNFAIRRDVFMQLGGMHPDIVPAALQRWQGDGETGLTRKAKAAGVKAVYVHGALVHHNVGRDRLTADYFCERSYYQGVCDSFSAIRAGGEPAPRIPPPRTAPGLNPGLVGWVVEAEEIRVRTVAAYESGWLFHQSEAASNPRLLEWIRRPDYLTADIRDEIEKTGHPLFIR